MLECVTLIPSMLPCVEHGGDMMPSSTLGIVFWGASCALPFLEQPLNPRAGLRHRCRLRQRIPERLQIVELCLRRRVLLHGLQARLHLTSQAF